MMEVERRRMPGSTVSYPTSQWFTEAVNHEACSICGISLHSECLDVWWLCPVIRRCLWVISPVRIQNAVCAMCTTDASTAIVYGVLSTRIFRTGSHAYSCKDVCRSEGNRKRRQARAKSEKCVEPRSQAIKKYLISW